MWQKMIGLGEDRANGERGIAAEEMEREKKESVN
jgi:hypothetical protein